MSNIKIWFVTGSSSGFGRAMTEHLLNIGNKVVATLRQPEALSDLAAQYPPTQLLVLKVDVTNKTDVTDAFAKVEETFGRIDVVFNNAGVYITGEVESVSEADARGIFDVNFWGAAHVSKEATRFFRDVNKPRGGRLLQVSSRLGLVGSITTGFYSASKFALEGLTEALAAELDPTWNIKVTIIEPGPYRTGLTGSNYKESPQHPAYADPTSPVSRFRRQLASPDSGLIDGDVTKAVVVIEKLSHIEDPLLRFPLHKKVLSTLRDKANGFMEVANTYESWTEDLCYNKPV